MPPGKYTFGDLAIRLNRPTVVLSGVQKRFELPAFAGAAYSEAYLAFLRTFFQLRMLGIAEDRILRMWHLEKKFLQLVHVDSTGSPTWFIDSCGISNRPQNRLLLTNYDIGVPIPARELQLGLNFADKPPELFAGQEMGEDALRVLKEYIGARAGILTDIAAELTHLREAVKWAARLS